MTKKALHILSKQADFRAARKMMRRLQNDFYIDTQSTRSAYYPDDHAITVPKKELQMKAEGPAYTSKSRLNVFLHEAGHALDKGIRDKTRTPLQHEQAANRIVVKHLKRYSKDPITAVKSFKDSNKLPLATYKLDDVLERSLAIHDGIHNPGVVTRKQVRRALKTTERASFGKTRAVVQGDIANAIQGMKTQIKTLALSNAAVRKALFKR